MPSEPGGAAERPRVTTSLVRAAVLAVLLQACRCGPVVDPAAPTPSERCAACHRTLYEQWASSMHAQALTSPVTVVQNNLESRRILGRTTYPDPRRFCINCHAPVAAGLTEAELLPLPGGHSFTEGIGCSACHQLRTELTLGSGGSISEFELRYEPGDVFFGPLSSPLVNGSHRSETTPSFGDPDRLCGGCHNVHLDSDGDGKITAGTDLVLQTTFDEFREYARAGGTATCVGCHMPLLPAVTSAIDGRLVVPGPRREVHDHSFTGVDHPLDRAPSQDPQAERRRRLLAGAADIAIERLAIAGDTLSLVVGLSNRSGHDLPTGFAFERQVWLEVVVKDPSDRPLFASGLLERASDDLCDGATFGEPGNPLGAVAVGCKEVDRWLVNLQLKLLDKVALAPESERDPALGPSYPNVRPVPGSLETVLQELAGGVVPRRRPADGASLAPLRPGARRSFSYAVPLPPGARAGSYSVRLLFRSLPPCFVRALGRSQPSDEQPRLEPLVANLEVVEVARTTGTFAR